MGFSKLNAIVGQSGGPTSAINATLRGVIEGASHRYNKLFGMKNGISGLLENRIADLTYLYGRDELLYSLSLTPASALGSCRFKLPSDFSNPVYREIFDILYKNDIGTLFYIGGNDSMDTVDKLSKYAWQNSLDVTIIGVPKTIDNDLVLTDHCPGYGSCAKYVATTVYEIARDISSYRLPSVTFVEVMGRESGFIGCASGLSKSYFGVGSDLVYIPEAGFSCKSVLDDIENLLKSKNNILVSVSEGVSFDTAVGEEDSFGHKALSGIGKALEGLVKREIGCKVRSIEMSLPQRCASHLVSKTDIEESVLIGKMAVALAENESSGKMASFVRAQDDYAVSVETVNASLVANEIKRVPRDFINKDGNFITDKCIRYISPLIQGEMDIKYVRGLPHHFEIEG
ncbi:MAG: diphosphate--fructose-6-phosphate 1-phosphotransferase [Clostridia bacterium]|nr:diphosphate--fructose-6-phosphate 1-phosphotransferase [Clostridia bacterium]